MFIIICNPKFMTTNKKNLYFHTTYLLESSYDDDAGDVNDDGIDANKNTAVRSMRSLLFFFFFFSISGQRWVTMWG